MKNSAKCPKCGKVVRICVPAGGDGSVDVYVRHKTAEGVRCDGSRKVVKVMEGVA